VKDPNKNNVVQITKLRDLELYLFPENERERGRECAVEAVIVFGDEVV
jgi:hypothetical protein